MKKVNPEVYFIGKTELTNDLWEYLASIDGPDWIPTSKVDGELLVEAAGRLCYRSWQPYDPDRPECSQPNVNKTRQGTEAYIKNIIKSGHGSVLEHVNMTFIFKNVSRILTHELVRHRAGCAYSQESLRYVRLPEISYWLPPEIEKDEEMKKLFEETIGNLETIQSKLADHYKIENEEFSQKKLLTSAFRRLAPIGLATNIMMTANIRALRHLIELRTSKAAEIEIRTVFSKVAEICLKEYPILFSDLSVNSDGEWKFKYSKV